MRLLNLLTCILFLCSCSKNAKNADPTVNPTLLKTFGTAVKDYNVNTDQGYVTLNIEDLPEGVDAEIVKVTGTTPFSTSISFETRNAQPGQHAIKLVSFKDGQTSDFVITEILLDIQSLNQNEHNDLFYQWTERTEHKMYVTDETGRGFNNTAILTSENNKLQIIDLPVYYEHYQMYSTVHTAATGVSVPLQVNCESGMLSIPETTVTSTKGELYTVSGTGTIDYGADYTTTDDKYNITYTTGKQTFKLRGNLEMR